MIVTTTGEPSSMFAKAVPIPTAELVKRDANGDRVTAPESLWNEAIENVICNGQKAFNELCEKYSAYKKPFHIGLLDRNGYVEFAGSDEKWEETIE